MIRYRAFLNSDARAISTLWNSQPPLRGRLINMTPGIMEQYVFSKPYFDPRGFIVAEDGPELLGFIHAGFAPGNRSGDLDRDIGLICLMVVHPQAGEEVAAGLIHRSEEFLIAEGAQQLLAGAVGLRTPFYLGIYGGSRLPGILSGDHWLIAALKHAGYIEHSRQLIWQRELADFRPPVDRKFMQMRRQFRFAPISDPSITQWNETCIWSWIDPTTFACLPSNCEQPAATLRFWDIEPLSSSWRVRAVGLLETESVADWPREDALPYFLGEALRHFQSQGVAFVEIQAACRDTAMIDACRRLNFREVDYGIQFRKPEKVSA